MTREDDAEEDGLVSICLYAAYAEHIINSFDWFLCIICIVFHLHYTHISLLIALVPIAFAVFGFSHFIIVWHELF